MSSQENKKSYHSLDINDEQVIEFFSNNPDFFLHHQDALLNLNFPHSTGSAVSILQYQIDRYRNQDRATRAKLNDLINLARENDRLSERVHSMTLSLIKLDSTDAVIKQLDTMFKKEFHADWVSIMIFDDSQIQIESTSSHLITKTTQINQTFENFFKANRPLCGRLKQQQLEFLFSDNADKVGSAVLLPLGSMNELGMIAIGSDDEQRFQSSMGTIYLNQMSQIITQILKRFID